MARVRGGGCCGVVVLLLLVFALVLLVVRLVDFRLVGAVVVERHLLQLYRLLHNHRTHRSTAVN